MGQNKTPETEKKKEIDYFIFFSSSEKKVREKSRLPTMFAKLGDGRLVEYTARREVDKYPCGYSDYCFLGMGKFDYEHY